MQSCAVRFRGKPDMKNLAIVMVVVILVLSAIQTGFAQSTQELKDLRQEIEGLKEGQKAMQRDLQEIKSLLRARPAAAPAAPQNPLINVEGAQFKGDKLAKLTLIEFSDFQ